MWAPILGTCKNNSYDDCKDVTKTQERLVSYQVCNDVPEEKCQNVDRGECFEVPDTICNSEQVQKCVDVPQEICYVSHKKVPVRVSRQVAKKVCNKSDNSKVPTEDDDTAQNDTINRINESVEFEENSAIEESVNEIQSEAERLVEADENNDKIKFNLEEKRIVFNN